MSWNVAQLGYSAIPDFLETLESEHSVDVLMCQELSTWADGSVYFFGTSVLATPPSTAGLGHVCTAPMDALLCAALVHGASGVLLG